MTTRTRGRRRQRSQLPWWSLAYLSAVVWPIAAMTVVTARDSTTFAVALANAAGFLLFSATTLQVLLVVRRGPASSAQRQLLAVHRAIGWSLIPLALAHVAILMVEDPDRLALLDVSSAPPRALAGIIAMLALLAMPLTTIFRRRLGLSYEAWRWLHVALTTVLVGGAYLHILLVSRYSADPLMRQGLFAFVAIAAVALWIMRAAGPFIAAQRNAFCLVEVRPEARACSTMVLQPAKHGSFSFVPGQFVWLKRGDRPLAADDHPFSIASSARRSSLEITIRDAGDFTSGVATMQPGCTFIVDGPHGGWQLPPGHVRCCVVVGGVGITPAMSLLRTMADDGDDREVALVVGTTSLEDVPFRAELRELSGRLALTVTYVVSGPTGRAEAAAQDPIEGERFLAGFVDDTVLKGAANGTPREAAWYVCGPPPMLDAVERALDGLGVRKDRLHLERYRMA